MCVCSCKERPWLEASCEWQVGKKEQTIERRPRHDVHRRHLARWLVLWQNVCSCYNLCPKHAASGWVESYIFSSCNQQKLKITRLCRVLDLSLRCVILVLCAETGTIFRHNPMHLCCQETVSDNMLRFFFFRNVAGWKRNAACGGEFTYRSHLNSAIVFKSVLQLW